MLLTDFKLNIIQYVDFNKHIKGNARRENITNIINSNGNFEGFYLASTSEA